MGFWTWIKSKLLGKPPLPPIVSLVLLLSEPRDLDAEEAAEHIRHALDVYIDATDDDEPEAPTAANFVFGAAPALIARIENATYLINCFSIPYVSDPAEAAEAIPELRLRHAVASHKAWLSVDLVRNGRESAPEIAASYQTIGTLLAELAGDGEHVLAILDPATNRINAFDPELLERLRSANPRSAVEVSMNVPVVPIASNDPRLIAAVQEARARWHEFVHAFENREPSQLFSVKAEIRDGDEREYMWVQVTALEGNQIFGILDNDPIHVRNVKFGSRVRIPTEQLNDWIFTRGDTRYGGFSIKILRDQNHND